jgi:hypothetical protein
MFIWMVAVGVVGPAVMFLWAEVFLPVEVAHEVSGL